MVSIYQHWSGLLYPFLWLWDIWGGQICHTLCHLDYLIHQQTFAGQRMLNAFFTNANVFDCLLFASLSSPLLSFITTNSSNSLFISFFLTLIFPSLLCLILSWLSWLLSTLLFLSLTPSYTISIPITELA